MRLLIPLGTRPEIVKLVPVVHRSPRSSLLGPPFGAATGSRTYCSAGAVSDRAVPGSPSGDPKRLLRVRASSSLLASGPPARTEIAGFAEPASTSGAGMLEGDLLAVPQAEDGPDRDRGVFLPRVLPGDRHKLGL